MISEKKDLLAGSRGSSNAASSARARMSDRKVHKHACPEAPVHRRRSNGYGGSQPAAPTFGVIIAERRCPHVAQLHRPFTATVHERVALVITIHTM